MDDEDEDIIFKLGMIKPKNINENIENVNLDTKIINNNGLIFIPGSVPSSKNSRITNTKTGRSFPSKRCVDYIKKTMIYYVDNRHIFKEQIKGKNKPYKVGFHFVRDSRRRYDWLNPCQTVQDIMVKNGWLDDDNTKEMFPFPLEVNGYYETIDKHNPGVFIQVL